MILSSKAGFRGTVLDATTGQPVRWVRWVDDQTGAYEAYREEPNAALWRAFPSGQALTAAVKAVLDRLMYRGTARLPITTVTHAQNIPVTRPAPLTPAQEAKEIRSIARDYGYTELVEVAGIECEVPGCHKLARWQTGDEQLIDPAPMPSGPPAERAFTKRVHRYCAYHYRPPIQTSLRGVDSEVQVQVRPR